MANEEEDFNFSNGIFTLTESDSGKNQKNKTKISKRRRQVSKKFFAFSFVRCERALILDNFCAGLIGYYVQEFLTVKAGRPFSKHYWSKGAVNKF